MAHSFGQDRQDTKTPKVTKELHGAEREQRRAAAGTLWCYHVYYLGGQEAADALPNESEQGRGVDDEDYAAAAWVVLAVHLREFSQEPTREQQSPMTDGRTDGRVLIFCMP